jgi:hypothetical protein
MLIPPALNITAVQLPIPIRIALHCRDVTESANSKRQRTPEMVEISHTHGSDACQRFKRSKGVKLNGIPRVKLNGIPRVKLNGIPRVKLNGIPRVKLNGIPRVKILSENAHRTAAAT